MCYTHDRARIGVQWPLANDPIDTENANTYLLVFRAPHDNHGRGPGRGRIIITGDRGTAPLYQVKNDLRLEHF
jgi:hypothetical protein